MKISLQFTWPFTRFPFHKISCTIITDQEKAIRNKSDV